MGRIEGFDFFRLTFDEHGTLKFRTELDALIAYLQVLGTMVDFTTYRPDATAAAAQPAKSASASQ